MACRHCGAFDCSPYWEDTASQGGGQFSAPPEPRAVFYDGRWQVAVCQVCHEWNALLQRTRWLEVAHDKHSQWKHVGLECVRRAVTLASRWAAQEGIPAHPAPLHNTAEWDKKGGRGPGGRQPRRPTTQEGSSDQGP